MSDRNGMLRPGWPAAVAGALLATGAALWLTSTAETTLWFTYRATVAGLVLFGLGLVFGSERLVGLAAIPVLTAAVLSTPDTDIDLGRALIIGCLWYISTELAWESIGWRSDTILTLAITTQRIREVATVVIIAIVIGLAGIGLATQAPSRTLLLRAFAVASVVIALAVALVQLNRTRSAPTGGQDGQSGQLDEASSNRS